MNRNNSTHSKKTRWSRIARPAGLALWIAAGAAWSANDLDTLAPPGITHPDGSNTYNTEWLGHNDLQGRTTYQTTVHTQGDRVIAYAGHFNGKMLNPMTNVVETNGTSIVDVTDPANPTLVSTPVTGQDVTHRNWWDCKSGIAYIVAGATSPSDAGYDGW